MSLWSIVMSSLAILWLLDGFRLRKRALALRVLRPSSKKVHSDHRFIVREGCELDEASRRAASALVLERGLKVLVLIPGNISAPEAMLSLQTLDPQEFRRNRIARGRCVGEAFLVHQDVLERMSVLPQAPLNELDFAELASELKKYASTTMDLALAPEFKSSRQSLILHGSLLQYIFGAAAGPVLLMQLILLATGIFFAPLPCLLALLVYQLQPLLVLLGTPFRSSTLPGFSLLRVGLDMFTVLTGFLSRKSDKLSHSVSDRRPIYQQLLAQGTHAFFESPRLDCPICGGATLLREVSTIDRIQFKPGTFTIDRCQACDHLFQNPRLSIAGLEFYYKDFYDGLGQEQVDRVFSHGSGPYLARARMLQGTAKPSRWLDVGAGHGHFCSVARDVWPNVPFDALDLSSSVEVAQQRGWADRSFRGLFPDLADSLAKEQAYDVISMSHYLEHTRDPASEIEAAAKVLPAGGHLLIELPDPACRLGQIFGSYWLPWFQPQHQHLLSTVNLERLLRENDFEPVTWHRGAAHQPTDFLFSMVLFLNQIAGPVDMPWIASSSGLARTWHALVFLLCFPVLIATRILDLVLAPLLRRPGWSNTYRVLARRLA